MQPTIEPFHTIHGFLRGTDFIFGGLQNNCRWWLQLWNWNTFAPWKKSYDQPRCILKSRDITLPKKVLNRNVFTSFQRSILSCLRSNGIMTYILQGLCWCWFIEKHLKVPHIDPREKISEGTSCWFVWGSDFLESMGPEKSWLVSPLCFRCCPRASIWEPKPGSSRTWGNCVCTTWGDLGGKPSANFCTSPG